VEPVEGGVGGVTPLILSLIGERVAAAASAEPESPRQMVEFALSWGRYGGASELENANRLTTRARSRRAD